MTERMKVEPENHTKHDFDNIFGLGYHFLLQDDEGIVVEYKNELYVIWKKSIDNTVIIHKFVDISMDEDDRKNIKPGSMLWMYDNMEN